MYTLGKGLGIFNSEKYKDYESYDQIFYEEIIGHFETGLTSGLLEEIGIEYILTGDSL